MLGSKKERTSNHSSNPSPKRPKLDRSSYTQMIRPPCASPNHKHNHQPKKPQQKHETIILDSPQSWTEENPGSPTSITLGDFVGPPTIVHAEPIKSKSTKPESIKSGLHKWHQDAQHKCTTTTPTQSTQKTPPRSTCGVVSIAEIMNTDSPPINNHNLKHTSTHNSPHTGLSPLSPLLSTTCTTTSTATTAATATTATTTPTSATTTSTTAETTTPATAEITTSTTVAETTTSTTAETTTTSTTVIPSTPSTRATTSPKTTTTTSTNQDDELQCHTKSAKIIDITSDEDCPVARRHSDVILRFSLNDKSKIEITHADLDRLDYNQFLNDVLIDTFIGLLESGQWIHLPKSTLKRVHILHSFFSRKMESASMDKWTQSLELFDRDYIFVPLNEDLHWSLAIVCFPNMLRQRSQDWIGDKPKLCQRPCILYLDSLGATQCKAQKFCDRVLRFLKREWEQRPRAQHKLPEDFVEWRTLFPTLVCQAPKQDNFADCGMFVLEYIQQFIKRIPHNNSFFLPLDQRSWFGVKDVQAKRQHFLAYLEALAWKQSTPESCSPSDSDQEMSHTNQRNKSRPLDSNQL